MPRTAPSQPTLPVLPPANNNYVLPLNTREMDASAHQHSPSPGANSVDTPLSEKKLECANINIATLNMNGLTAPARGMTFLQKWSMVNQTLNKFKIVILALQEMHLDHEHANNIHAAFGKKMEILTSEDPTSPRATAGVAFMINKSLIAPRTITTHDLVVGRALMIKVEWLDTESTTLINIYAPIMS